MIEREDESFETTVSHSGRINPRIGEILDCGLRYARLKLYLRRNRRKIDSRKLSYAHLMRRIRDEVNELEQALIDSGILTKEESGKYEDAIIEARAGYNIENIAMEAGNIICFASMICDKTEEVEEPGNDYSENEV